MLYDDTVIQILQCVYEQPGIHKRELAKRLNKGMPSIDYALKKLQGVIKQEASGNQMKHYLDYTKEDLTPLLVLVERSRVLQLPQHVQIALHEYLKVLQEKPLIAILFGSYAQKTATQNSDVDLLLVYQQLQNTQELERQAHKTSMNTNTNLQVAYVEYKEFKTSYHDNTKHFYKNLKEHKLVLVGMEWWRQLASEQA